MPDLSNQRAIVTGASSGIGAAMARQLAAWGCDVVMVARRKERLDALAEELRQAHDVDVEVVALDLTGAGAPAELLESTNLDERPVDILVNNAGMGYYEPLANTSDETALQMLQLNVQALTALTHRFVRTARERARRSYVLNVSSMLGFAPCTNYAIYAATKAYIRSFSEAVAAELRGTPVTVTCLCPGGTESEFHDQAGQDKSTLFRWLSMSAERCARIGLKAMLRRRRHIVSGYLNKAYGFMTRLLPRRLSAWFMGVILGRSTASSK
jgi:short-subunit dehydrogenase